MSIKDDIKCINDIPIGITPHNIWKRDVIYKRAMEIYEAIERYKNAEIEIPQEWITEYNQLRDSIYKIEE